MIASPWEPVHGVIAEVFARGTDADKTDMLSWLDVFSREEKAALWGYLGQQDQSLRSQMQAFKKSGGARASPPPELALVR